MSWQQWMLEEQAKKHPENAIYINGVLFTVADEPFEDDYLMIEGQKAYVDKPMGYRIKRFFRNILSYFF